VKTSKVIGWDPSIVRLNRELARLDASSTVRTTHRMGKRRLDDMQFFNWMSLNMSRMNREASGIVLARYRHHLEVQQLLSHGWS